MSETQRKSEEENSKLFASLENFGKGLDIEGNPLDMNKVADESFLIGHAVYTYIRESSRIALRYRARNRDHRRYHSMI